MTNNFSAYKYLVKCCSDNNCIKILIEVISFWTYQLMIRASLLGINVNTVSFLA